jgi:hypothetical protein
MKAVPKRIWLAFVAATAMTAGLQSIEAQPAPPQIIILSKGEQYQFAGVTYDTINVPPPFRKYVGTRVTQFNEGQKFETPQLFVWFHWVETNVPSTRTTPTLVARLADQSGVERGALTYPAFTRDVTWDYAEFPVIPRRSQMLQCNFYPIDDRSPGPVASISFTNPLYGNFPEWKSEPLPAVKRVGDLEVRLEDLMTGIELSGTPPVLANGKQGISFRPAQEGTRLATFFDVSLTSARGTNEQWVVQSAELSDATGNVLASPSNIGSSGDNVSPMTFRGEYRLTIPGTLWPDEAAWRLKLELKRKSGYSSEEFVTFHNVPVPKVGTTNFPPITNTVGGVQLVLKEFVENGDRTNVRYPRGTNDNFSVIDRTPETLVAVELPGHPEGVAVDFVKLTTDTSEQQQKGGNGWRPFYRAAYLRFIPTNVASVDITWVVQKTRSVEFLVKPPLQN